MDQIGESGSNQRLGRDSAVLGTRVWDQHAGIEIQLGPLGLQDFKSFLPTEWGFGVQDCISFYLKGEFDFNIRLILKAAEIPPVSLDMEPALSWMSWLGPSRTVKVGSNGHGPTPPDENPSIVIDPAHSDSRARRSRVNFSIDCRAASSRNCADDGAHVSEGYGVDVTG